MMQRVTIEEKLDDGRYKVSFQGVDSKNVQSAFPEDYTPENGTEAFVIQVGKDDDDMILIAIDDGILSITTSGEKRIYSVVDGEVKASILLNKAGEIISNEGTDYAVRFSNLETEFNELKGKFNELVDLYNGHGHSTTATPGTSPNPGEISGPLKSSYPHIPPLPSEGDPSEADITTTKIESLRVP